MSNASDITFEIILSVLVIDRVVHGIENATATIQLDPKGISRGEGGDVSGRSGGDSLIRRRVFRFTYGLTSPPHVAGMPAREQRRSSLKGRRNKTS